LGANAVFFVVRTFNATVAVGVQHGASARLTTSSAAHRAARPGRPARQLAVDSAGESVASKYVGEGRTSNTTILHRSDDRTRLGLGTSAAGLGAGAVARPCRDLAVNGASLGVAGTVFVQGAVVTAVLGRDVHIIRTGLGATTARLRACGPGVPGVFAIKRARVGVAVLLREGGRANNTAMGSSGDDGLGASLHTTVAVFRTRGPSSPARNLAINGASERIASGGRRKSWAGDAIMSSSVHNRTRLSLGTGTTGLGAGTVSRPTGNLAVDGASERIAGGGRRKSGAGTAAVNRGVHHRTRLGLGASAAGLGASTVSRPARDLAVNGAKESVAGSTGRNDGAANTTVAGSVQHRTSLGLGTSAARLGASTVGRPGRDLAVNGAGKGVATRRRRK